MTEKTLYFANSLTFEWKLIYSPWMFACPVSGAARDFEIQFRE